MAACGSPNLLHGSLPSPPRSATHLWNDAAAAARSIALATGGSWKLPSSEVLRNAGERSGWRAQRMVSASSTTDDRVELDENPEGIISGEWPENFSLLSYDDLRAYLEPQILKDQMKPSALLGDVMSAKIRAATADQTLEEIDHHFEFVSGLPVIDDELRCVGVISKTDKAKAPQGVSVSLPLYPPRSIGRASLSPVSSSRIFSGFRLQQFAVVDMPASSNQFDIDGCAWVPYTRVKVLMLKKKIHRIPVLNEERQVIGMVTRTDIFQALEAVVEV